MHFHGIFRFFITHHSTSEMEKNIIEAGERIGFDEEADRQRFHVSAGGITVVRGGRASYFARGSRERGRRSYSK